MTSQSTGGTESLTCLNASGGTQTITARLYFYESVVANSCNTYRFAYDVSGALPDDLLEDIDDPCNARQILGTGFINNLVVRDGDADFFEFVLFPGEVLEVSAEFSHADGDIDMQLHEEISGYANTQHH